MRNANIVILNAHKEFSSSIAKLEILATFLDDYSFLIWGRDNIVCKDQIFSLQTILNSAQATLGNVIECCKCFCLADAYTLLRKYRDDLFFCLYIVLYDSSSKLELSKNTRKMEANIEKWCKNNLSNLNISEVLSTIGTSTYLKDAVRTHHLQDSFDRIGKYLNNYIHGNGRSFYNIAISSFSKEQICKSLDAVVFTAQYITTTFLFLLALCSPQYIMSTDYISHLEAGQSPPSNSQYWVAPFVVKFFKDNMRIIDKNCYKYLKENTCMFL